jgi:hypothetical protein
MNQADKKKDTLKKNTTTSKIPSDNETNPLDLNVNQNDPVNTSAELNPERLRVVEEISDLFGNEDIVMAVKKFKTDSEEKKIAVEFANSHIQFLNEIIESDHKKGIARKDVEIRDFISHANVLLQKKDEYLFTTIITHSPAHYRNIQKSYYSQLNKEE